jgi:hypothetical protein
MTDIKKINRELTCIVTGKTVTVKPEKYERLLKYHGSDEKVLKTFICYGVEKESRNPSFLFWFENCNEINKVKQKLRPIFLNFKNSKRFDKDVKFFESEAVKAIESVGLNIHLIEFLIKHDELGGYAYGIKIKNIPFIRTYEIILLE